jgi:hypothetical protein
MKKQKYNSSQAMRPDMMYAVTSNSVKENEKSFWSVFRTTNAFDRNLFQDSITSRLILHPTDNLWLTEKQYEAFLATIKREGDTEFYISELSCSSFTTKRKPGEYCNRHWKCTISCLYGIYSEIDFLLDVAIFSKSGQWGIWISNEETGAIGGSKMFIDHFKLYYPDWITDWESFQKEYKQLKNEEGKQSARLDDYVKQFQQ